MPHLTPRAQVCMQPLATGHTVPGDGGGAPGHRHHQMMVDVLIWNRIFIVMFYIWMQVYFTFDTWVLIDTVIIMHFLYFMIKYHARKTERQLSCTYMFVNRYLDIISLRHNVSNHRCLWWRVLSQTEPPLIRDRDSAARDETAPVSLKPVHIKSLNKWNLIVRLAAHRALHSSWPLSQLTRPPITHTATDNHLVMSGH